jgi:two-component system invasion response regulator UvrY
MTKIKVGLVDDHKLFREGLHELINGYPEFSVIVEADHGKDLISKISPKRVPDIILLDINMKEMDGFQTAEWLKVNYPTVRILALSMYENENAVIRMLRLGARGYILKDIRKQELHQALLSIAEKGYYFTELITGKLIHAINTFDGTQSDNAIKEVNVLSAKEIDFLRLACTELTYKEISEKMHVSPHTIDGYRDSLFEKLHVRSRVGLVLYAIKNKIFHVE